MAPTLESELMQEFDMDAAAADAAAAELRSNPHTAPLTGLTLGDLRHAVETSLAGDLFRELKSLRRRCRPWASRPFSSRYPCTSH